MNEKIDTHYHLGRSWSRKGKLYDKKVTTPSECAQYCKDEGLTHIVLIYVEEDRHLIDEIRKLCPTVRVYPAVWISDLDKDQWIDGFDDGIKLHGLRTDYDLTDRKLKKLLKRVPKGFKVIVHTQGSSSVKNTNTPLAVGSLASAFPELNFVIGHAGDFGFLSWRIKPEGKDPKDVERVRFNVTAKKILVSSAVELADEYDNILLDSSMFWPHVKWKIEILMRSCSKWSWASDWPFCISQVSFRGIKNQEKVVKKHFPDVDVDKIHQNGIDFWDRK